MSFPSRGRFSRGTRRFSYEVKNGVTQAKLLERHVLREIVDRLWYQARIKVWQINQPWGAQGARNENGIPDLVGFVPWRTPMEPPNTEGTPYAMPLYIEVKRPGGERREMQKRFIEEAKQGGCIALFAESWADVKRELQGCGIKLKEID